MEKPAGSANWLALNVSRPTNKLRTREIGD